VIQHHQEKIVAPHGYYAVKPHLVNRHVRPAAAIITALNAELLERTKTAWTGTKDRGGHRRVFGLDDLVGEDPQFRFELEKWDGR
jgi:hypothetical protein